MKRRAREHRVYVNGGWAVRRRRTLGAQRQAVLDELGRLQREAEALESYPRH